MPVLSNNGRLISSLPIASSITGGDEFLLQTNGITKRVSYSALSSSILSSDNFSPFNATVNFTSLTNKFTGSFYNPNSYSSNFYTVRVRDNLTVNGKITGNLTGSVYDTNLSKFMDVYIQQELTASDAKLIKANITDGKMVSVEIDDSPIGGTTPNTIVGTTITANTGFTGNITSTGTSTFSSIDVNGGAIDGTIIGASSAAAVTGTTITANTGFVGNLTGNLTGDVYNSTATKVLESGNTTPTVNGGVTSAFFYGTSSYATQALTAAYAAGGVGNGLPAGGSAYQVLNKNTNTSYDAGWVTPITRSGVPNSNYLTFWSNPTTVSDTQILYTTSPNVLTFNPGTLKVKNISILGLGCITGSYKGLDTSTTISSPGNLYEILQGHIYPSILLELSASGYCTMSLMAGQTTTVFVQNSGNFKVLKWSGSLDGGSTANTKIYWKNGLSASITQGDQKKDIITFVNINNKIFGSAINNFQ